MDEHYIPLTQVLDDIIKKGKADQKKRIKPVLDAIGAVSSGVVLTFLVGAVGYAVGTAKTIDTYNKQAYRMQTASVKATAAPSLVYASKTPTLDAITATPALEPVTATPTLEPITATPTSELIEGRHYDKYPFLIDWVINDTSVTVHLLAGDVLYLSASHWVYKDCACENYSKGGIVCVLAMQASKEEDVTISNLIAGHAQVIVTDQLTLDELIQNREPYWFTAPNCDTGCTYAKLFKEGSDGSRSFTGIYADGRREHLAFEPSQ